VVVRVIQGLQVCLWPRPLLNISVQITAICIPDIMMSAGIVRPVSQSPASPVEARTHRCVLRSASLPPAYSCKCAGRQKLAAAAALNSEGAGDTARQK
jgi:hypothetical protein